MPEHWRKALISMALRSSSWYSQLDGEWLERLRRLLQEMGEEGGAYPLHRYLEELLEADIVYRENNYARRRGPFVQREAIIRWLRQQRGADNATSAAAVKR